MCAIHTCLQSKAPSSAVACSGHRGCLEPCRPLPCCRVRPRSCSENPQQSHFLALRREQVRAEDVYLPEEATFVIANSLAESQKAVTADKCAMLPLQLSSASSSTYLLSRNRNPVSLKCDRRIAPPMCSAETVGCLQGCHAARTLCLLEVIAHPQSSPGHRCYNLRVVECRLAAVLLALALGQDRVGAPLPALLYRRTFQFQRALIDCCPIS